MITYNSASVKRLCAFLKIKISTARSQWKSRFCFFIVTGISQSGSLKLFEAEIGVVAVGEFYALHGENVL